MSTKEKGGSASGLAMTVEEGDGPDAALAAVGFKRDYCFSCSLLEAIGVAMDTNG
jgi:hypothetical protein